MILKIFLMKNLFISHPFMFYMMLLNDTMLDAKIFTELKFSKEKWCKYEFDVGQNEAKWGITVLSMSNLKRI